MFSRTNKIKNTFMQCVAYTKSVCNFSISMCDSMRLNVRRASRVQLAKSEDLAMLIKSTKSRIYPTRVCDETGFGGPT